MTQMASQLWVTLDSAGVKDPAVLVGLSMGGYVSFEAFRLRPERVRALALVSTKAGPDTPVAREGRFKNIELVQREGPKALADKMIPALFARASQERKDPSMVTVGGWIASANPSSISAALRGMAARADSTPLLRSISAPILALSGNEDAIIPSTEMKKIVDGTPKADFDILPNAGHLLNLEQPRAFNESLLRFLKRRVL
jgi:3-oxoadipate enol-lactonase